MSPEEKEVHDLVVEWYVLATRGHELPDTSIFRFLALWIAFNGLYSLSFSSIRNEIDQVRAFGSWSNAKLAHAKALDSPEYSAAIDVLRERGVFNFLKGEFETLTDESDLSQVILLVYRVRCNLFHGRKVPTNLRDRRIIEAAHAIVRELMSRLLLLTPA